MKKLLYTFIALSIIFSACKKENDTPYHSVNNNDSELAIGDTHQGGIFFYEFTQEDSGYVAGEIHGLIAAPSDSLFGDTVASWGCNGTFTGANGTIIGTGLENTEDILSGCPNTGTAAAICDSLTLEGYDDWFLPSKDELNEMYLNLYIQGLGGFFTYGDIGTSRYWSSTEYDDGSAWVQNFYDTSFDGFPTQNSKGNMGYVRAIRTF